MRKPTDHVVHRYLLLGLRLGQHIEGIVDAYYGPPELAQKVESEALTAPTELAHEAALLQEEVAEFHDSQRARWLQAQLDGIAAVAERLAGETLSYTEEVRRCYGVEIHEIDEGQLAEALDALDRLVPGNGPLRDRYRAWYQSGEIANDALPRAVTALKAEVRRRTLSLYGLPDGEAADVELVANQPWAGFNYYLGGLKSRIAINIDLPVRAAFLTWLIAHEAYPGHHTERSWKESLLVRGRGYFEESIFLIGTPQCLLSEGIAGCAADALGPDTESVCESRLADLGFGYDVELSRAISNANRRLSGAGNNALLMLHDQRVDPEAVKQYLRRWTLATDEDIEKRMEFWLHPVWRTYDVVYETGRRIVETWTAGRPERFRRLLTEQLTSSDLTA